MEAICYHAYWASTELAKERSQLPQPTKSSLWDQGILPLDTLDMRLAKERRLCGSGSLQHAGGNADAAQKKIARTACAANCIGIAHTRPYLNIIGVDACIRQ